MELSSHQQAEIPVLIPIPIDSTSPYVGEHGNGHGHEEQWNMTHHRNGSSVTQQQQALQDHHHHQNHGPHMMKKKKKKKEVVIVKYKECLKNHAASMGGNVLDGCGEFMPSGEEGTLEALTCSACNCHRNFHRKESQGSTNNNNNEPSNSSFHKFGKESYFSALNQNNSVLPVIAPEHLRHQQALMGYPARAVLPQQMILPYNVGPTSGLVSESDEQEDVVGGGGGGGRGGSGGRPGRKRFRTKFTQEQKEKMLNFAERVGWKIQKQEDSVLQQFCEEIGVRRRVLKVWMHNNKHNLAKKINNPPLPPTTTTAAVTTTAATTTTALFS